VTFPPWTADYFANMRCFSTVPVCVSGSVETVDCCTISQVLTAGTNLHSSSLHQGGFTTGERTSSLPYIYSRCTYMELFQWSVAPLVLKFGIHQGQVERKGVRRGEEEGMSRGVESQCS
jgi:hypothetical protein